jgi:membrane complex biogenesis BtpA family protein
VKLPELIGVIHLPPLPGSPGAFGKNPARVLEQVRARASAEARLLEQSGFDGIMIENFGDAPFYKTRVPPETIAAMALIAAEIRKQVRLPMGINVLRNDADAALAVAAVSGAEFIRINVLSGVVATDQGLIEGDAARIIREKQRIGAKVGILADVHVKHAKTLSSSDLAIAIEEVAGRGGADAVIVTGSTTGRAPDAALLGIALRAASHAHVPLYVGSGMSVGALSENIEGDLRVIVGSALRKGGRAGAPLDAARVTAFARAWAKRNRS